MRMPHGVYAQAFSITRQLNGLTPTEKDALFLIWCINGHKGKPLGPTVVATNIGVTKDTAKNALAALRRKGYLTSTGRCFVPGHNSVATRRVTNKAGLPQSGNHTVTGSGNHSVTPTGNHLITQSGNHSVTMSNSNGEAFEEPPLTEEKPNRFRVVHPTKKDGEETFRCADLVREACG